MGGVNPAGNSSIRENRLTPRLNPQQGKTNPVGTPDADQGNRRLDLTLKRDPSRGSPKMKGNDGREIDLSVAEETPSQTKVQLPVIPTLKSTAGGGKIFGFRAPLPPKISNIL